MKIQDMNVLVYHFQTFTVKHSRSSRIEYNFCKAGWRLTKGSLTLKYYWKIFIFNLRKGKSKTKRNISIIIFFFSFASPVSVGHRRNSESRTDFMMCHPNHGPIFYCKIHSSSARGEKKSFQKKSKSTSILFFLYQMLV